MAVGNQKPGLVTRADLTPAAKDPSEHWLLYEPGPRAMAVEPHPSFPHTPLPKDWMPKLLYRLSMTGKMKAACDYAGVSTAIPRHWATRDPSFAQALEAAMQDAIWSVEDKLIDDMDDKRNPQRTVAKIFYLKGRRRGVFGDTPSAGDDGNDDTSHDAVITSLRAKLRKAKRIPAKDVQIVEGKVVEAPEKKEAE